MISVFVGITHVHTCLTRGQGLQSTDGDWLAIHCSGKSHLYELKPLQGGHPPGKPRKVGEFESGQGKREKLGKVCSLLWYITMCRVMNTTLVTFIRLRMQQHVNTCVICSRL